MTDRSGLLGALQFLTRIPIRTAAPPDIAGSVTWFPVAGAMIGAIVGGIAAGMHELVSPAVGAAVAVLAGMLVTGAFHEDGLADTADAVAGGGTRERRLEILKDPRHGTYGVAALCGSIVLRVVALASVGPAAAFAGAVAAHGLGRGAAVVAMGAAPVARPVGLGADYAGRVGGGRAATGGVAAVAIAAVSTGWWSLPMAAGAALAAVAVAGLSIGRLGGLTGDVLGAIEQVAECTVLVVVAGLATRHSLWWT